MTSMTASHWPIVFICVAMIAAAVIDWWKFKVPNRLTFPIILSGWAFGALHSMNLHIVPGDGYGGIGAALLGTAVGGLLLIVYAIGGVGGGDVKMSMGFGSWIGAYYGYEGNCVRIILTGLCAGILVGGVIGFFMILVRRNFKGNVDHTREIVMDVLTSGSIAKMAENAQKRRPRWHRLPYGVPLCIGFLGYLYVAKPELPNSPAPSEKQEARELEGPSSSCRRAPACLKGQELPGFVTTNKVDFFVTTKRVEVVGAGESKIKRVTSSVVRNDPSNRSVHNESEAGLS